MIHDGDGLSWSGLHGGGDDDLRFDDLQCDDDDLYYDGHHSDVVDLDCVGLHNDGDEIPCDLHGDDDGLN